MTDYEIVVPASAERVDQAVATLAMLPSAKLFVPLSDLPSFVMRVEDDSLVTHDPFASRAERLNGMLDAFDAPVVVHVPDGFAGVGIADLHRDRYVRTRDPATILDVIESALVCAEDLDVGVFGWLAAIRWNRLDTFDPVTFGRGPMHAWGVRGAARSRRFKPHEEPVVGYWLDAFAHDRIVYVDQRFTFEADNPLSEAEADVELKRRFADAMVQPEFKILIDAEDEAGLAALYDEMLAQGREAKLIT